MPEPVFLEEHHVTTKRGLLRVALAQPFLNAVAPLRNITRGQPKGRSRTRALPSTTSRFVDSSTFGRLLLRFCQYGGCGCQCFFSLFAGKLLHACEHRAELRGSFVPPRLPLLVEVGWWGGRLASFWILRGSGLDRFAVFQKRSLQLSLAVVKLLLVCLGRFFCRLQGLARSCQLGLCAARRSFLFEKCPPLCPATA